MLAYFNIKDFKRAEYNPRKMPESEMNHLMTSISTHGFVEPIVVNIHPDRYGVVVGGHQRLTALEKLIARGTPPKGIILKDDLFEVPVYQVDLPLEAEQQLNIALNNIHGEFDDRKLHDIIVGMQESPTLDSTGFDSSELADILSGDGVPSEASDHGPCARCKEIEKQAKGHCQRSGHVINIQM